MLKKIKPYISLYCVTPRNCRVLSMVNLFTSVSSRVKKRVSERVLCRAMYIIRSENLSETLSESFCETLGETFRAHQASPQSLESDYMHGSPQTLSETRFFQPGQEWRWWHPWTLFHSFTTLRIADKIKTRDYSRKTKTCRIHRMAHYNMEWRRRFRLVSSALPVTDTRIRTSFWWIYNFF